MQTLEFTKALQDIRKQLKITELIALSESFINTTNTSIGDEIKNLFTGLLLDSYAAFVRLNEKEPTKSIFKYFRLADFYSANQFRQLTTILGSVGQTQQISGQAGNYIQFYSFLELWKSFVRLENATTLLLEKEKVGELNPSEKILEVELIEYADETGISPKRLQIFIDSITDLHMVLAQVYELPTDKLTFKYFDSGSGLLIGIQAAKAIVEGLSNLLEKWLDKFRYWDLDKHDRNLESFTKNLLVVEAIHNSVQKGAITPETGEIYKARVFKQADTLIGIGATTPIKGELTIDKRQLLTELRNTKLLTDGSSEKVVDEKLETPDGPSS